MQVFADISAFRESFQHCVATIGKYDGLHLGHQQILKSLLASAESMGLPSVVILSEPQPEEFFSPENAPPRLNHFGDKVQLLDQLGIDAVYKLAFDKYTCQITAEDFVKQLLVDGLGIRKLVIGDDFRFGKGRSGDFSLLAKMGENLGFEVQEEQPCENGNERISSTLVRQYLQDGRCKEVYQLLNRYYSISGEVVEGKKLGRELGFPTANITLQQDKLPVQGIFAVQVAWHGKIFDAVASAGFNPAVDNSSIPLLEVYLLDFDENLYGQTITVTFLKKIREEKFFPSLDLLREKITQDVEQARQFFNQLSEVGQV